MVITTIKFHPFRTPPQAFERIFVRSIRRASPPCPACIYAYMRKTYAYMRKTYASMRKTYAYMRRTYAYLRKTYAYMYKTYAYMRNTYAYMKSIQLTNSKIRCKMCPGIS